MDLFPSQYLSSVGKSMERLVINRLLCFAESMHLLTEYDAEFRHGCCTEEQLLRLSQSIGDGFRQSSMQRTMVALIDYSWAYDKEWRDALLMNMFKKALQVTWCG